MSISSMTGTGEYRDFEGYSGGFLPEKTVKEKIDTVVSLEKLALEYDKGS